MKLGQMISMDAGDLLPPELQTILSRLRDQAYRMPPAQLDKVLRAEWGADWRRRFRHFEAAPMAAASIGQVHRATLPDGRVLAIKVQSPGVRDSIGSDVDNVAPLLRVSTLIPPAIDLKPLLAEAKTQLAEEADYIREADRMRRFAERLAGNPRYVVPRPELSLTTPLVLAMDYIPGQPIETLVEADQETRDGAMTALIDLVLHELFDFGMMQTDPNFANYRWQPDTRRLVLLDFGAARDVPPETVASYRRLIEAGLAHDRDRIREIAVETGFLGEAAVAAHRRRSGLEGAGAGHGGGVRAGRGPGPGRGEDRAGRGLRIGLRAARLGEAWDRAGAAELPPCPRARPRRAALPRLGRAAGRQPLRRAALSLARRAYGGDRRRLRPHRQGRPGHLGQGDGGDAAACRPGPYR